MYLLYTQHNHRDKAINIRRNRSKRTKNTHKFERKKNDNIKTSIIIILSWFQLPNTK